jgi:hypothetical protein
MTMIFVTLIRTWANVTHVFVEESIKEKAKAAFGYTSVPFYVVFNKVRCPRWIRLL